MLVLSRKPGEKLVIGDNITITILEVVGSRVRVGIEAPSDVRILRGELAWWQEQEETTIPAK
ncbi:MAG: carbon storage regulator [Gemmataceae bacterium]|nr:carbon storage regulator [Gemmataceae bacterium]